MLPDAIFKLKQGWVNSLYNLLIRIFLGSGIVHVVLDVKTFAKIYISDLWSECETKQYRNSYTSVEELGGIVRRFWQLDKLSIFSKRTEEEEGVKKVSSKTIIRDATGMLFQSHWRKYYYIIGNIGTSTKIALRQFTLLENRLGRYRKLKKQYINFMTSGRMVLV